MSKVLLSQTKMQRKKKAFARKTIVTATEQSTYLPFIMDHLTLSILNAILKNILEGN